MPRDGSGNYSLPAGNPFVTGTTISSSTMNSTMTDIATALTGSLSRSGLGGMLVAFQNTDGVVGAPGITFANETSSGFYRAGSNDVRLSIGGTAITKTTGSGFFVLVGTTTLAGALTVSSGGANITGGLTVDGIGIASGLPSMTGNSGKWATNNGSAASWAYNPPDQTGNKAKMLRTDGSSATGVLAWTAANVGSSSVASYSNSTTTYTTVGSVASFVASGRPIKISIEPAAHATNIGSISAFNATGGTNAIFDNLVRLKRDSTVICTWQLGCTSVYIAGAGGCSMIWNPNLFFDETPAAGTYTYTFEAKLNTFGSGTFAITNCSIVVIEM